MEEDPFRGDYKRTVEETILTTIQIHQNWRDRQKGGFQRGKDNRAGRKKHPGEQAEFGALIKYYD